MQGAQVQSLVGEHAMGQLSLCTTTTELVRLNKRACMLQTTEPMCSGPHQPQLDRENPHAKTREKPAPCIKQPVQQQAAHAAIKDPTCHDEDPGVLQLRPDTAHTHNKDNK